MIKTTEHSDFWLGSFPSERRAYEYFEEMYNDEDEDREYTPLSEFAKDQEQNWYDHDFIEYGFNNSVSSIKELVEGYSYSEQYAEELEKRCEERKLVGINFFLFITVCEIAKPKSVITDEFKLHYVGKVEYQI